MKLQGEGVEAGLNMWGWWWAILGVLGMGIGVIWLTEGVPESDVLRELDPVIFDIDPKGGDQIHKGMGQLDPKLRVDDLKAKIEGKLVRERVDG